MFLLGLFIGGAVGYAIGVWCCDADKKDRAMGAK
jgi:uncharacterized membrane protein YiaA